MAERVPGIIVRVVNDTGIVAPPLFQRYPIFIGCGDPYNLVQNAKMTRGLGSTDLLPSVNTVHTIVSVGDLPGIAKYVDMVDYELVGGTNNILWLGANKPVSGNQYYATYTETRSPSAYQPILYFDDNLVYTDHGGKLRIDGSVNDVSYAAYLAFTNGSKGVMVLQLPEAAWADKYNPTVAELETAFVNSVTLLETIMGYKLFLIGMSSGTLLTVPAGQILFNHAVLASQPENKQERTVIMPMPADTPYQDYAAEAQAFSNNRMVIPAIPSVEQLTGVTGNFDDRYYCAGLAGLLCSGAIGDTFHGEIVAGITFNDNFRQAELDYLVQNGVSPAQSQNGIIRNVMALTTDVTNALTEDLGVQDISDYVKKYWREGLWNLYRNKPINSSLLAAISGSSITMMEYLVSTNVLSNFDPNIVVSQDPVEPRKILVYGRVMPAFRTAWMDISFTFVLSL
jgi:hypothetical protein